MGEASVFFQSLHLDQNPDCRHRFDAGLKTACTAIVCRVVQAYDQGIITCTVGDACCAERCPSSTANQ
jgi:hypothetical protein